LSVESSTIENNIAGTLAAGSIASECNVLPSTQELTLALGKAIANPQFAKSLLETYLQTETYNALVLRSIYPRVDEDASPFAEQSQVTAFQKLAEQHLPPDNPLFQVILQKQFIKYPPAVANQITKLLSQKIALPLAELAGVALPPDPQNVDPFETMMTAAASAISIIEKSNSVTEVMAAVQNIRNLACDDLTVPGFQERLLISLNELQLQIPEILTANLKKLGQSGGDFRDKLQQFLPDTSSKSGIVSLAVLLSLLTGTLAGCASDMNSVPPTLPIIPTTLPLPQETSAVALTISDEVLNLPVQDTEAYKLALTTYLFQKLKLNQVIQDQVQANNVIQEIATKLEIDSEAKVSEECGPRIAGCADIANHVTRSVPDRLTVVHEIIHQFLSFMPISEFVAKSGDQQKGINLLYNAGILNGPVVLEYELGADKKTVTKVVVAGNKGFEELLTSILTIYCLPELRDNVFAVGNRSFGWYIDRLMQIHPDTRDEIIRMLFDENNPQVEELINTLVKGGRDNQINYQLLADLVAGGKALDRGDFREIVWKMLKDNPELEMWKIIFALYTTDSTGNVIPREGDDYFMGGDINALSQEQVAAMLAIKEKFRAGELQIGDIFPNDNP